MERGMKTHNYDEDDIFDGLETQERLEIEDYYNSDKVMASSAARKVIWWYLETLKVKSANLHKTQHCKG